MSDTELLNNLTDIMPKADGQDDDSNDTNVAKSVTIVALFFISMGSGLIPFALSKCFNWSDPNRDPRTNLVISSLLSFGGGALLCTTLIHLLPEIDVTIADLQADGILPSWEFSLANLLMAIGFFIIYLVEEIVHAYLRRHQKKALAQEAFLRGHSARESLRCSSERKRGNETLEEGRITVSTVELVNNEQTENSNHSHHHHHSHSHIHIRKDDDLFVSSIRGLLIVLALSVHELFEGLAVGLEETSANVWYMFGSVTAHKLVIAFCIGVELMVHKTKTWLMVVYIFVYAIVSPLGIAVGIWLSNAGDSEGIAVASVILQGLASGTLLYVIFFEILAKHRSGIVQYLSVLFGFFLMFGLKFIAGHNHTHDGDEGHDGHKH